MTQENEGCVCFEEKSFKENSEEVNKKNFKSYFEVRFQRESLNSNDQLIDSLITQETNVI